MPLSEHEQRMLEQMEHALTAEDPKFASSMVGKRRSRPPRTRLALAVVGVCVGLALVFVGINTTMWVGVAGFALMVAAVAMALAPHRGPGMGAVNDDGSIAPRPPARKSAGFMDKLDDRWDRRSHDDWR